jgi:hypothetical protein
MTDKQPNNYVERETSSGKDTFKHNENALSKPVKWTQDHEKILIDWADKAMCYRWLHSKSNNKYSRLNTYFTIPVIIMSTITGTANFASERVPPQYRGYYSMTIGGVNIIAGIITTIQQFLKVSEINEAHRASSISWDKFYRKIRVELAKPPNERQNVYDFLKSCTEEFDRLMEISPNIEKGTIELFNKTFNETKMDPEQWEMFNKLGKPEICNSLVSVRESMYTPDETSVKRHNMKNIIQEVIENNRQDKTTRKNQIIKEFVEEFRTEMMRGPTKQELLNNLDMNELNDLKISEKDIENFISNNKHIFEMVDIDNDVVHDINDIETGNNTTGI